MRNVYSAITAYPDTRMTLINRILYRDLVDFLWCCNLMREGALFQVCEDTL